MPKCNQPKKNYVSQLKKYRKYNQHGIVINGRLGVSHGINSVNSIISEPIIFLKKNFIDSIFFIQFSITL